MRPGLGGAAPSGRRGGARRAERQGGKGSGRPGKKAFRTAGPGSTVPGSERTAAFPSSQGLGRRLVYPLKTRQGGVASSPGWGRMSEPGGGDGSGASPGRSSRGGGRRAAPSFQGPCGHLATHPFPLPLPALLGGTSTHCGPISRLPAVRRDSPRAHLG